MLEVHAILQRQRCNENITKKTGTLSDAYHKNDTSIITNTYNMKREHPNTYLLTIQSKSIYPI